MKAVDTKAEVKWSVYILATGDNCLYTGIATDVSQRLAQHRAGRGAKYLRGRGPLELLYQETGYSRSEALRREYHIKQLSRAKKLALIGSGAASDVSKARI